MSTRTFTAIVNPTAGDGAAGGSGAAGPAALLPLARLLREAGARVTVDYSRDLGHAAALARQAVERGDVVLGVGGDGMAGCVGGAVAGTGGLFGIVPAGRGNDFARQLGIRGVTGRADAGADADGADGDAPAVRKLAAALLEGEPHAVDAIEVTGADAAKTVVLGSVYAGVDAVANRNANRSRLLRGSAAYYVGALRAVVTWRPAAYRITVDGQSLDRRGYTVVAANSGFYGFGLHVAPEAEVDDGLLDVVIIKHAPKPLFFAIMKELETGAHVRRDVVEVLRGREVRIEADRALPYGADGELIGVLPVTARVLPGALRVLGPGAA
ncbi:MAG TPA: diacylglycerol kinase family protein [Streptosporangiaceae bacterium]|nr:diacylglycerol kinase family protein [Streptosporangiaceae bacterium]